LKEFPEVLKELNLGWLNISGNLIKELTKKLLRAKLIREGIYEAI